MLFQLKEHLLSKLNKCGKRQIPTTPHFTWRTNGMFLEVPHIMVRRMRWPRGSSVTIVERTIPSQIVPRHVMSHALKPKEMQGMHHQETRAMVTRRKVGTVAETEETVGVPTIESLLVKGNGDHPTKTKRFEKSTNSSTAPAMCVNGLLVPMHIPLASMMNGKTTQLNFCCPPNILICRSLQN